MIRDDINKVINHLIKDAHQNAVEKGWHDKPIDFGTTCMNIVGEISEGFNEYAHNRGLDEIYFNGDKPEGIPIELADAVIRIFDLCGKHNIPLAYALNMKMTYNKTRSYRHGNKRV
jgi:NTP pyrophosphatase (non-canonical NTP hydrolase)